MRRPSPASGLGNAVGKLGSGRAAPMTGGSRVGEGTGDGGDSWFLCLHVFYTTGGHEQNDESLRGTMRSPTRRLRGAAWSLGEPGEEVTSPLWTFDPTTTRQVSKHVACQSRYLESVLRRPISEGWQDCEQMGHARLMPPRPSPSQDHQPRPSHQTPKSPLCAPNS